MIAIPATFAAPPSKCSTDATKGSSSSLPKSTMLFSSSCSSSSLSSPSSSSSSSAWIMKSSSSSSSFSSSSASSTPLAFEAPFDDDLISFKEIARTPLDILPNFRTESTSKRISVPSVAPTKTESPFLATKTCFNLSPSSKAIALFPFLLMLANSFAETFLITPLSVIMTRKVSSSSSPSCGSFGVFFFIKAEGSKLKMAVIDSPLSMSTNLVNGVPCAVVDASGMSKALTVKTFPLSVKKKTRSKSFACITFAMESDPFNFDIDFPRVPLR